LYFLVELYVYIIVFISRGFVNLMEKKSSCFNFIFFFFFYFLFYFSFFIYFFFFFFFFFFNYFIYLSFYIYILFTYFLTIIFTYSFYYIISFFFIFIYFFFHINFLNFICSIKTSKKNYFIIKLLGKKKKTQVKMLKFKFNLIFELCILKYYKYL